MRVRYTPFSKKGPTLIIAVLDYLRLLQSTIIGKVTTRPHFIARPQYYYKYYYMCYRRRTTASPSRSRWFFSHGRSTSCPSRLASSYYAAQSYSTNNGVRYFSCFTLILLTSYFQRPRTPPPYSLFFCFRTWSSLY
jgi:hypothetical protein